MRSLSLALVIALAANSPRGPSEPPVDNNVALRVSLATDEREFRIRETIPIRLSFSTADKGRYEINRAGYDRSGRMPYEQFSVSPADGAVDPLANRPGGIGGGLTTYKLLGPEPWTITLNLNEWLRFTRPGQYRLTTTSTRVAVKDPADPLGASPVTARGNQLVLNIVPATRAWQKAVYDEAMAALGRPAPTEPSGREAYTRSRREALETLRFLGTPEATRELARNMRGEERGGLDHVCMLGLISAPDREVALGALEDALADPDHPMDDTFLYTLQTVRADPVDRGARWREDRRETVEDLIAVLPAKRGKALSVSLHTAANAAWNAGLPKQATDKLVKQLVSTFDQLPEEAQASLLTYRWDEIAGPAMLPILRRRAQADRVFHDRRDPNAYRSAYRSRELSGSALQRWYELDPSGARPVVINEIARPRPRYGARVLGILPDETLPEVESALVEHFIAGGGEEGSPHLASLIARYATDAVLPQVLAELDPRIGKWECGIQDAILAYVLRVSPALARPRIEQALAARGEGFTGCYRPLLVSISEIHYDPALEDIGVRRLDDPDPQVAMTAAAMLGRFGSAAVEGELWRRYERWCAKWKGRESELNPMFSELSEPSERRLLYERVLGEKLMEALATGKAWLSDESKLRRLSRLTEVNAVRGRLEQYLSAWKARPLTIFLNKRSAPLGFEARVAQYELRNMDALKEKLGQFPPGTEFLLAAPPGQSPADDKYGAEVRAFLDAQGLVVAGEKEDR